MDSYSTFHADERIRTPQCQFCIPNQSNFIKNIDLPQEKQGFLYAGFPPATRRQLAGNSPATRRQPPREAQLGPSGRPTQQEPFARRSREKGQLITKETGKISDVFKVFEKTRSIPNLPSPYFLYVGTPT